MKLSQYYTQATIYPSAIILVIAFVHATNYAKDYKSEWLTADTVVTMEMLYAVGYCLLASVSCLSIFLCQLPEVRKHPILTFLSWFLLPLSFFSLAVGYITSGTATKPIYPLLINALFVIALVWTFIRFKRQAVNV